MIIDTHAHINFKDYAGEVDLLLEEAQKAGVSMVINPGTTLETSRSAIKLAQKYSQVYAAVGIHPTDVEDVDEATYPELERLLKQDKVVALGEVGLDFYHQDASREKQLECLDRFVDMAKRNDKPLIIHNRDSDQAMAELLGGKSLRKNPGVFHCFSGDRDFAKIVLNLGFYISFTGIVTFKNAKELQEVAQYVPLERILVETDSPYLTPHPHRGKRNEPKYTRLVVEKIAELKAVEVETVIHQTTQNAKNLFQI